MHIGFSIVLLGMILLFNSLNDDSVINNLFKIAGYTYGPILGLFVFAMLTNGRKMHHMAVMANCLAAPILSYVIDKSSADLLGGFQFGFLILLLNGLLTYLGLMLSSSKA